MSVKESEEKTEGIIAAVVGGIRLAAAVAVFLKLTCWVRVGDFEGSTSWLKVDEAVGDVVRI